MKVLPASTSVVERFPTAVPEAWFSATVVEETLISVGASLTLVTVTEIVWSVKAEFAESVALTITK